jgi:tetratricopeptide (TPR) repeat protein
MSQYDRAIADFNQAIRLDPDSIFALNNRGAAYARKGQYDDAIADFNEAIRIDASYAITYNNRGIAYAKKGQYDRAIEDFDQAIRFDPKDASAFKNRNLTKQLMGTAAGANTEVASTSKSRSLTEQMKEPSPNADAIEANASKIVTPVQPPKDNSPNIDTNDARAFPKRSAPTQLDAIGTDIGPKTESSQQSRKPASVAVKNRSKPHLASVHPHQSRPKSALARFFKKNPLVPNFQKFLKLASRRGNASAKNNY